MTASANFPEAAATPPPATPSDAAEAVAAAVSAHPGVARLDGGPFGTIASHLPGRRVVGVRLPPAAGAPAEIAVVTHAGTPLPRLADELATLVKDVLGEVPVDVTVVDVVPGPGVAEVASAVAVHGVPENVPTGPGRHSAPQRVT